MAKKRERDTTNPIKATGATKARTRQMADRADPRGRITDKNSRLDRMLRPGDTAHASQQGGSTAWNPALPDTSVRKGRVVGARHSDQGLIKNPYGRSRPGKSRSGNRDRGKVRASTGARSRGPRRGR